MKASMGLRTQAGFATLGTAGRTGAWKDQGSSTGRFFFGSAFSCEKAVKAKQKPNARRKLHERMRTPFAKSGSRKHESRKNETTRRDVSRGYSAAFFRAFAFRVFVMKINSHGEPFSFTG
jgi:hypothetical protein